MWWDPTCLIWSGSDDLCCSWSCDPSPARRLGIDASPLRWGCDGSDWNADAGKGWESTWLRPPWDMPPWDRPPWDSMRLRGCWDPTAWACITAWASRACWEPLLWMEAAGMSGGDTVCCWGVGWGGKWPLPPLPAELPPRLPGPAAVRAAVTEYPDAIG